ncbi:hypothetical protein B0H15DRAFT_415337 [Mycena belliarum]|uniref:DUF6534 domain-containing protein n=1 Tax=Mycena belliarum TaxID=1033014 RepID=A0AAD6XS37_9AGAR|nr:hypothetical protein B0H15DRAFT_415337 [Mycena belliae]
MAPTHVSRTLIMSDSTTLPASMVAATFGGAEITMMIASMLYGVTILQTYMYFLRYSNDGVVMRSLVFILWILDTIHTAFVFHVLYFYTMTTWTKPSNLLDGVWSNYSLLSISTLMCLLVQLFYARTIYLLCLGRWKWLSVALLGPLILASSIYGVINAVRQTQVWELTKLVTITHTIVLPYACIRIAVDVITSISLCILLRGKKNDIRSTTNMVNTLILYATTRFLATSSVSIFQIIVLGIDPTSLWGFTLDYIIGKLYVNSLLANLNSRDRVRAAGGMSPSGLVSMFSDPGTSRPGGNVPLAVSYHQEQVVTRTLEDGLTRTDKVELTDMRGYSKTSED